MGKEGASVHNLHLGGNESNETLETHKHKNGGTVVSGQKINLLLQYIYFYDYAFNQSLKGFGGKKPKGIPFFCA